MPAPAPPEVEVYIGLGSNLGQPREYLRAGLDGLNRLPSYRHLGESSCYVTAPVGRTDQPAFFNAVARGMYNLAPLELLEGLLAIETAQGRQRREHWGPRTLDLDLLLFGRQIIGLPRLKVPHPQMAGRAFVLVPLLELAPNLVLPGWELAAVQLMERLTPEERALQKVEKVPWV